MSFFTEYFNITEEKEETPVCCPFPHLTANGIEYLESNPSAHVNLTKKLFHCKACNRGYSEAQFIEQILGCKTIDAKKIASICENTESMGEYFISTSLNQDTINKAKSYGITDEVIEELHLSSDDLTDNIVFPVFMYDMLMDTRTYNPGGTPKVKSRSGAITGLIIPFNQWISTDPNRWTLLCAGEKDMAVARSHGFNAITITGGEQATPKQLKYFKDRKVAIVYDNDDTGKQGANKLASVLYPYAKQVKVVTAFHEICKENKEDITDFFNKYNGTADQLKQYIIQTEPFVPSIQEEKVNMKPVTLLEASNPNNLGKLMQSNIQIIANFEEAFSCPSEAYAEKLEGDPYQTMTAGETKTWELKDSNAQDLLHLIDNNFNEEMIKDHLKTLMRIPVKEKFLSLKITKRITVFKAYVTDLFETDIDCPPAEYTVYILNKKLESGKKYLITYKLVPHPYKGQQFVMIATDCEQAGDSVSNFDITQKVIDNLQSFEKLEGTVEQRIHLLSEKVKKYIAYDGNNTLISSIDLAFHTVLQFNFNNFKNVRGYLDMMVITESRVGKSSTAEALRKLYGLGTKVSLAGNAATIPGLIGGSNKLGNSMQTRAGIIPQNNKGLIIFEEFGKSNHDIIKELTEIRSSNEVRITRVSGNIILPALVRMITLTNPKTLGGEIRSISSYPNGFQIITELVDTAEDIARYDAIVILSDKGNENQDSRWEPIETFEPEVYRDRIRWIWSRKPEEIILSEEIKDYIIECANKLNSEYNIHIKLFGTEAWKKLSRLSIAVAGYLVSTDETYRHIIVKKEHVDYAVKYLLDLYDNNTFKLKEYVEEERMYTTIDEIGINYLQEIYDKYPLLILQLEKVSSTTKNTLQASTGLSNDDVIKATGALGKGFFIKFSGFDIVPTEKFRIGITKINKNTSPKRLGEIYA